MDPKDTLVAAVVVILSMMMAASGYMVVSLMDSMNGGDRYFHEDSYTVTGTYQDGEVTGQGESHYSKESDNCLIYRFDLRLEDEGGNEYTLRAVLLCDGAGSPTEDFELISQNPDGTKTWAYEEYGIRYEYRIGDNNLVRSLTVTSDKACVLAEILA